MTLSLRPGVQEELGQHYNVVVYNVGHQYMKSLKGVKFYGFSKYTGELGTMHAGASLCLKAQGLKAAAAKQSNPTGLPRVGDPRVVAASS